jgi:hypothetical protein
VNILFAIPISIGYTSAGNLKTYFLPPCPLANKEGVKEGLENEKTDWMLPRVPVDRSERETSRVSPAATTTNEEEETWIFN